MKKVSGFRGNAASGKRKAGGIIIVGVGSILGAILLAGCAGSGGAKPVVAAPETPVVEGVICHAVVAGLTAVDPRAYGGWAGECPGCDIDAQVFADICRHRAAMVTELHNAQATKAGLIEASKNAWAQMKAGDVFVLYVSGHGGQVLDVSGDEEDGQDETLCLWDGELSDDVLMALWQEAPPGVRVFFVSDTCNSGSNFRARPRYRPRRLLRTLPRNYAGQLIHYGGCADGQSSFGDESGGTFTTALLDGWTESATYASWFQAAAAHMPKNQFPFYGEYGPVTDAFRNTAALR